MFVEHPCYICKERKITLPLFRTVLGVMGICSECYKKALEAKKGEEQ